MATGSWEAKRLEGQRPLKGGMFQVTGCESQIVAAKQSIHQPQHGLIPKHRAAEEIHDGAIVAQAGDAPCSDPACSYACCCS